MATDEITIVKTFDGVEDDDATWHVRGYDIRNGAGDVIGHIQCTPIDTIVLSSDPSVTYHHRMAVLRSAD